MKQVPFSAREVAKRGGPDQMTGKVIHPKRLSNCDYPYSLVQEAKRLYEYTGGAVLMDPLQVAYVLLSLLTASHTTLYVHANAPSACEAVEIGGEDTWRDAPAWMAKGGLAPVILPKARAHYSRRPVAREMHRHFHEEV